jgi:Zn-dependent protease with chaperone function
MTSPGNPNDQNGAWTNGPWQAAGPENSGPHHHVPPTSEGIGPFNQLPPYSPRQLPGGSDETPRAWSSSGRIEVSAAETLLSMAPWLFWSLIVVSWIASIIGFGYGWILVGLWLLSGAVVLVRPIEDFIARHIFGLRQPTIVEHQRIEPVWRQLAERARVDPARYSLWLQESEEINALPTPGHTIALTTWSLYTLPGTHLEAVLAHEVSHHLGGRDWLSLLSFWYSIPARCALWSVRGLARLMKAVPAVGCVVVGFLTLGYLGLLLTILIFDESFVLPLLFLTPFVAPPILAWLGRREVSRADRRAAAMGYGAALVQVLYGWQFQHQGMLGREASRRSQLMSSAPSIADRVRMLERLTPSN